MLRSLILVATVVVTLAAASTAAADAPRPLGGLVDLEAYCQTKGYDWVVFPRGQLGHNTAVSNWRCATAAGESQPLNMTQACKWQYGTKNAHAHFTNRGDAFTWVCYSAD